MDLGLNGNVALVTGASKGIGRGIAAELVAEGARVAISSHSRERVEATAAELGATAYVHDTSDHRGLYSGAWPGVVRPRLNWSIEYFSK